MRDYAENHEPGPSTTRSAASMAAIRLHACRWRLGQQTHAAHLARRRRDRHLSANRPAQPRVGLQPRHVGPIVSGTVDIGSTRPPTCVSPRAVSAPDRITEQPRSGPPAAVPDRMAGLRCGLFAEAVLRHNRPTAPRDAPVLSSMSASAAWCDEEAASAIRRSPGGIRQVELAAQLSGRPAVVGDGDDCGDIRAEVPHRSEGHTARGRRQGDNTVDARQGRSFAPPQVAGASPASRRRWVRLALPFLEPACQLLCHCHCGAFAAGAADADAHVALCLRR